MPDRCEVEVPGTQNAARVSRVYGCTQAPLLAHARATAKSSERLANSRNPRAGLGQRLPAWGRGVDVCMGGEQLFGEVFALAARGEREHLAEELLALAARGE